MPSISEQIHLRQIEKSPIKRLPAFSKKNGHFLPQKHNFYGDRFVKSLMTEKITEEIQELYLQSKKILGLKRKEITKDADLDGAVLETPFFVYQIISEQCQYNPEHALLIRRLYLKTSPSDRSGIDQLFRSGLNEVVFPIETLPDFDDAVERFEDLEEKSGGELTENDLDETINFITPEELTIHVNFKLAEFIIRTKSIGNISSFYDMAIQYSNLLDKP